MCMYIEIFRTRILRLLCEVLCWSMDTTLLHLWTPVSVCIFVYAAGVSSRWAVLSQVCCHSCCGLSLKRRATDWESQPPLNNCCSWFDWPVVYIYSRLWMLQSANLSSTCWRAVSQSTPCQGTTVLLLAPPYQVIQVRQWFCSFLFSILFCAVPSVFHGISEVLAWEAWSI